MRLPADAYAAADEAIARQLVTNPECPGVMFYQIGDLFIETFLVRETAKRAGWTEREALAYHYHYHAFDPASSED